MPLWLALHLKRQQRAVIEAPEWLSVAAISAQLRDDADTDLSPGLLPMAVSAAAGRAHGARA